MMYNRDSVSSAIEIFRRKNRLRDFPKLIKTKVASGFEPTSEKFETKEVKKCTERSTKGGGYLVAQALSWPRGRRTLFRTKAKPQPIVAPVIHPNDTTPLLGLQLISSEPSSTKSNHSNSFNRHWALMAGTKTKTKNQITQNCKQYFSWLLRLPLKLER